MIYLIYGILITLSVLIVISTVVGVFRVGEKENICDYDYIEK